MLIDTKFNFHCDSMGGDPDIKSPTLRRYHKILWSKPLPSGTHFHLQCSSIGYLHHKSELGAFILGSDSIAHSYKSHRKKLWLTKQIPDEVNELRDAASTIGAYIIFPSKKIQGKHTINQARGVNTLIDDRFDLTIECIRRFYLGYDSPLKETLLRYKMFFELFEDFSGYIQFFLLQDLVDENDRVKFYLPFNNFSTPPSFSNITDYRNYKNNVMEFIKLRNRRVESYALTLQKM